LLDRAALHITSTEIGRAAKWFSANPTAVNAVIESLRVYSTSKFRADVVPILFVWANIGDEQGLCMNFSKVTPQSESFRQSTYDPADF
jgi:hypothetical protein